MINFDEELKQYQPSVEVEQAVDMIYKSDIRDVTDIMEDMIKGIRNGKSI